MTCLLLCPGSEREQALERRVRALTGLMVRLGGSFGDSDGGVQPDLWLTPSEDGCFSCVALKAQKLLTVYPYLFVLCVCV